MYSAAKAELEQDKKQRKQQEDNEISIVKIEEDKAKVEKLLSELSELKSIPRNQLYILDSSNIAKLTTCVESTVKGYQSLLDNNLQRLQKANLESRELANALTIFNSNMEEIKLSLSQIWQQLMRKGENVEREKTVLQKLDKLLP